MSPRLLLVEEYLESRLKAELSGLKVVAIESRLKSAESIYQKLQTGRYKSLEEVSDLVGVKVVVLRRSDLRPAIDAVIGSSMDVVETNLEAAIDPVTFAYSQPHIIVQLPGEFRERNPEVSSIRAEIQVTTALQHALDMATHDFDYKGKSFAWANFRIVAQLRGSLELIDSILDDVEASSKLGKYETPTPPEMVRSQQVLDALVGIFGPERLPEDLRRMSMTVGKFLIAAGVSPENLGELAERNQDLRESLSLSATDAVLGMLIREKGERLIVEYQENFCVSPELLSICEETQAISEDKRVTFKLEKDDSPES